MKKLLLLLLLCVPFIGLTQSTNNHNNISWLELIEAERFSEKSNSTIKIIVHS